MEHGPQPSQTRTGPKTMEEIPDYPEDVIMEDLSDDIYKPKATKLLNHDGQETRDGKKTGKNKAKKGKNKLNKSC